MYHGHPGTGPHPMVSLLQSKSVNLCRKLRNSKVSEPNNLSWQLLVNVVTVKKNKQWERLKALSNIVFSKALGILAHLVSGWLGCPITETKRKAFRFHETIPWNKGFRIPRVKDFFLNMILQWTWMKQTSHMRCTCKTWLDGNPLRSAYPTTRWAPTSYKWSYNPHEYGYNPN